jgi:hypothetical protein
MNHLERLSSPDLVVRNGAPDSVVDFPCFKIGAKLQIDGLRLFILVKPAPQVRTLLRRQPFDSGFNIFQSVEITHCEAPLAHSCFTA